MDARTQARFEARSKIIKALAHPSRLFIVDELSRGRRCVNDLAGLVEADISTVSKHLSILRDAGVVRDEKEGARVYYSLRVPCVLNFFSCVETVMAENAKEQAALLE
jgi:DNA-binding transcriptional ArsR family regulator